MASDAPHTRPTGDAWWLKNLPHIASDLNERKFVVIDEFMGREHFAKLRAAAITFGSHTPAPPLFDILAKATSELIAGIQRLDMIAELEATRYISCALTRLVPGIAQARHVDNPGGRGTARLTMTYYMQDESWNVATCGGCLRIFRPGQQSESAPAADGDPPPTAASASLCEADDVLATMAPIGDRLVVFFSDDRCPHAVLPVAEGAPSRYTSVLFYGEIDYEPESENEEEITRAEWSVDFT